MAQTQTGGIIAWVQGGQKYATEVDFEDGELISICTCPYGNNCKHAVAVALEYLDHLKKNLEIPQITGQDLRIALLQGVKEDEDIEGDYDEEEEGVETINSVSKKGGKSIPPDLRGFLEQQPKNN